MSDNTWMEDAACRGMNPDVFFPQRGESTAEARAVCARCPVILRCRHYALANYEKYGIWGGMSERERRRIRKPRRDGVRPWYVERPDAARQAKALLARGLTAGEVAAVVGVNPQSVKRFIDFLALGGGEVA